MNNRQTRLNIGFAIAAVIGVIAVQYVIATSYPVAQIPYSQFQQLLHDNKIEEVAISDRYIQGKLKAPLPGGQTRFETTRVDLRFADELQKYNVRYTG